MERRDDGTRATVETIKGDTFETFDTSEERVRSGGERTRRVIAGEDMPSTTDYDRAARDERDDEGGI